MRIAECELNRYKRFALNDVSRFHITIKELVQMILGTNGSGKSSLLKELTILPADAADYLPGGSKIVTVFHNGDKYVGTSTFDDKGGKHHLMKNDDEELNPGGTQRAQLVKIKEIFGITPDIHDLLTGLELFHAMSPTDRRRWFTQLSDVSYDYALLVFKRLSDKHRDIVGAMRMAKQRLVSERAKIITPAEEEKLKADVDLLHHELGILAEQRAPLDRPLAEIQAEGEQTMLELRRTSDRLLRLKIMAPYGTYPYGRNPNAPLMREDVMSELMQRGFESIEDIDLFIDHQKHGITSREALINQAMRDHGKIAETIGILRKTGSEGVDALRTRWATTAEKRQELLSTKKLGLEGFDAQAAYSGYTAIYDALSEVFSTIESNEDRKYTTSRLEQLRTTLRELKDRKAAHEAEANSVSAKKAHMNHHKEHGNLICPNCKHTWSAGFDALKMEQFESRLAELERLQAENTLQLKSTEEDIAKVETYSNLYREFVRTSRVEALKPFWEYLTAKEYVITAPRKALADWTRLGEDLKIDVAVSKVEVELKEIQNLIQAAADIGDASLAEQEEKLTACTLQIETLTAEIAQLRAVVESHAQYKRELTESQTLKARVEFLLAHKDQLRDDLVEGLRRSTINHCIRQLQQSLAIKSSTLSEIALQKGIIKDLETSIAKLEIDEEASKKLVRELSPTDGLIAEGLLGFIRNFTDQMNRLIRKIWTYPLEIRDCGIANGESAELDYKFPLMVGSKSNVVADIKLGSAGMKEIVNLAFKIVSMRYLGLAQSPLYLDEFGAALDEEHRVAGMQVVKMLMDTQPFTQLFMVSHYQSFHGAFTNAEVCVLDARNISIPSQYNQHVEIS